MFGDNVGGFGGIDDNAGGLIGIVGGADIGAGGGIDEGADIGAGGIVLGRDAVVCGRGGIGGMLNLLPGPAAKPIELKASIVSTD